MPVKRIRPVGRPSFTEVALLDWAFVVAKDIEAAQQDLEFIATGDSLDEYEVEITKKNQIEIRAADYLKFSMGNRGRQPGGKMPPIQVILDWIEVKGIVPDDDMSVNSLAFLIARKQQQEGNLVYRKQRPGIPIELIIDDSWDMIADQLAFDVATAAADLMMEEIKSYK